MKLKKSNINTTFLEITEGKRFLKLTFQDGKVTGYDSNLPYQKSCEDWDFYGRAILRIIKIIRPVFEITSSKKILKTMKGRK